MSHCPEKGSKLKKLHKIGLSLLLLLVVHLGIQRSLLEMARTSNSPDSLGNLQSIPPGEAAGIALLGGFRSLAADILWVKAVDRYRHKEYYDMIPISTLIVRLQPNNSFAWIFLANRMIHDIPTIDSVPNPKHAYRWFQEGIALLEAGEARLPNAWNLPFEKGHAYWLGFSDKKRSDTLDLFLADSVRNPNRRHPLIHALESYEHAVSIPAHRPIADWYAIRTYRDLLTLLPPDHPEHPPICRRAKILLQHFRSTHPEEAVPLSPANQRTLTSIENCR